MCTFFWIFKKKIHHLTFLKTLTILSNDVCKCFFFSVERPKFDKSLLYDTTNGNFNILFKNRRERISTQKKILLNKTQVKEYFENIVKDEKNFDQVAAERVNSHTNNISSKYLLDQSKTNYKDKIARVFQKVAYFVFKFFLKNSWISINQQT